MVIHPSFGKMICYSAILLLSLFFEPNWGQSFEGLASLISNLVSLDNSDLVFISDFQTSQQVSNFQLSNATVFENQQKCLILKLIFVIGKTRLCDFSQQSKRCNATLRVIFQHCVCDMQLFNKGTSSFIRMKLWPS